MPWEKTIATKEVASNRLEWAGGGDPDVYTKPGRTTRVSLVADNIRFNEDGMSVLVDIYYSVKEMRKNHTFLRWRSTEALPIPRDARNHTMEIMDVRGFDRSWYVRGQIHDFLGLAGTDGTVIKEGTYRIDGRGNDQYNAGINLVLEVPIRYYDQA